MSKKIVVTGGSGAAASYVIKELLEHGYEVKNLDITAPQQHLCPFEQTNLSDYTSVRRALGGFDAVIAYASKWKNCLTLNAKMVVLQTGKNA